MASHCDHAHATSNFNRAFAIGVGLNLGFVLVEAVCGVWADSLALLADAGHNFSDVLGLLLAWGASRLALTPPSDRRTYGLRRTSILAALGNAIFLLVAIGGLVWEAVRRFETPAPVAAGTVAAVAAAGVVVNAMTALLFLSGRKHDLNIRGAYLHMAADAGVSAGVVVAALAIGATGCMWIDPVTSLVIAAVIAAGTWGLLRESLDLALDAVPANVELPAVAAYLGSLPGVTAVHDLHVWPMSTTETALTARLVKPDGRLDDALLARACDELRQDFGISHSTLQLVQASAEACHLAPREG